MERRTGRLMLSLVVMLAAGLCTAAPLAGGPHHRVQHAHERKHSSANVKEAVGVKKDAPVGIKTGTQQKHLPSSEKAAISDHGNKAQLKSKSTEPLKDTVLPRSVRKEQRSHEKVKRVSKSSKNEEDDVEEADHGETEDMVQGDVEEVDQGKLQGAEEDEAEAIDEEEEADAAEGEEEDDVDGQDGRVESVPEDEPEEDSPDEEEEEEAAKREDENVEEAEEEAAEKEGETVEEEEEEAAEREDEGVEEAEEGAAGKEDETVEEVEEEAAEKEDGTVEEEEEEAAEKEDEALEEVEKEAAENENAEAEVAYEEEQEAPEEESYTRDVEDEDGYEPIDDVEEDNEPGYLIKEDNDYAQDLTIENSAHKQRIPTVTQVRVQLESNEVELQGRGFIGLPQLQCQYLDGDRRFLMTIAAKFYTNRLITCGLPSLEAYPRSFESSSKLFVQVANTKGHFSNVIKFDLSPARRRSFVSNLIWFVLLCGVLVGVLLAVGLAYQRRQKRWYAEKSFMYANDFSASTHEGLPMAKISNGLRHRANGSDSPLYDKDVENGMHREDIPPPETMEKTA